MKIFQRTKTGIGETTASAVPGFEDVKGIVPSKEFNGAFPYPTNGFAAQLKKAGIAFDVAVVQNMPCGQSVGVPVPAGQKLQGLR